MDFVKRINETLHTGDDWGRVYNIKGDIPLEGAHGVCKLRTVSDKLILEADCTLEGNRLIVWIRSDKSLKIKRSLLRCKYDVFLITPTKTIKLVMGTMTIVHDVSMH